MADDSAWGRLKRGLCPSCGEKGPHFVPPSLGDDGFYYCTETLNGGRRVPKTERNSIECD